MAGVSLSVLAAALASMIGQEAGVAAVAWDETAPKQEAAERARDAVCAALAVEDCQFPLSAFIPESGTGGGAERMEVTFPDGRVAPICLIRPPSSKIDAFASTQWIDEKVSEFDRGRLADARMVTNDEVRLYSLLVQAGSCARDGNSHEVVAAQREVAFASLAAELILSDPAFLGRGGESAGNLMAKGVDSQAGTVAASVAHRVLAEGWKDNLVELVEAKGSCRAIRVSSRQPLAERLQSSLDDEKALYACLAGTAPYGTSYEVSDVSLAALAADPEPSKDLLERFDREVAGVPSKADLAEVQAYVFDGVGLAAFGGSLEAALSYAWKTSGQIVGIP